MKKSPSSTRSVSPAKKSAPKSAPKKSAPKAASKRSAPKKSAPAPKKTPAKKAAPVAAKKVTSPAAKTVKSSVPPTAHHPHSMTQKDGIKSLGILHVVGNIISGGTLGIILVLLYLLFKKQSISQIEKETCYEIINFNLSFLIYSFVAGGLIIAVIGLILLPIVLVTWFVLMIKGFIRHLAGENYKYPFIIRFVS